MQTIETGSAFGSSFGSGRAHGGREHARAVRVAGGVTTGVFATMMTASGIAFVLAPAPVVEAFGHLGYPLYFARLLGLAKLLGVAALLAPRVRILREWAYAGFAFVLVAAVLSHGLSGDGAGRAAPAAFTLGLLLASYFLRRRLSASGSVLPHRPAPSAARSTAEGSTPERKPMTAALRRSIWFGRLVLAAATLLFSLIALRQIADPIGASTPHQIALGSSDAITIMRVTGGLFLGLALVLAACVVSERRLLTGLGVLATVNGAVTAVRLMGLIVDGPGPFTLRVLEPEVALVALSAIAFLVERRRRRRLAREPRGS
jgi:DoxX-like protein